jgi:hypothetical protein
MLTGVARYEASAIGCRPRRSGFSRGEHSDRTRAPPSVCHGAVQSTRSPDRALLIQLASSDRTLIEAFLRDAEATAFTEPCPTCTSATHWPSGCTSDPPATFDHLQQSGEREDRLHLSSHDFLRCRHCRRHSCRRPDLRHRHAWVSPHRMSALLAYVLIGLASLAETVRAQSLQDRLRHTVT